MNHFRKSSLHTDTRQLVRRLEKFVQIQKKIYSMVHDSMSVSSFADGVIAPLDEMKCVVAVSASSRAGVALSNVSHSTCSHAAVDVVLHVRPFSTKDIVIDSSTLQVAQHHGSEDC